MDQLKAKHNEISLRISSLHLASKSMLNVMEVYKLLLNEHGRMRVNNFLIGQNVRLTITPIKKKHFFMDIHLADEHIDRISVTPDGYTAEKRPHL